MQIATNKDPDLQLFKQLKRKTPGSWRFLLSGEWSQSPYHQGNVQFYVRSSNENKNWAILSSGFPNRIVVVAIFDQPTSVEEASGFMLQTLEKRGGEYIEFIHHMGSIDKDKFWEVYERESS